MKRWAGRIVRALLVGAIATIVVAWGAALMHPGNRAMTSGWCIQSDCDVTILATPGATRVVSIPKSLPAEDLRRQTAATQLQAMMASLRYSYFVSLPLVDDREVASVPAWSTRCQSRELSVEFAGEPRVEDAAGWPLRALVAVRPATEAGDGFRIRSWGMQWYSRSTAGLTDRVLPFRPIWLGFVINTICYALLWMLAVGLRRRMREQTRVISRRAIMMSGSACMIAGVLTTIVVSWWIAMYVPLGFPWQNGYSSPGDGNEWVVTTMDDGVALRIHSSVREPGWRIANSVPILLAEQVAGKWVGVMQPDPDPDVEKVVDARLADACDVGRNERAQDAGRANVLAFRLGGGIDADLPT